MPPKPAEASKVQPKKETVRINLPPKPTSAPTIKLPTLAPGTPPASSGSAAPVGTGGSRAPGLKRRSHARGLRSGHVGQTGARSRSRSQAHDGARRRRFDRIGQRVGYCRRRRQSGRVGGCGLFGFYSQRPCFNVIFKKTAMTAQNVLKLNQANFSEQVLGIPGPVVVDFWAEWCGPCKMMAPLLDELSGEYDGRVRIGKVNIDEEQALAAEYGVRAIPTLLFFKSGEVAAQIVGMCSKRDLKANIDRLL